ncbi:MAG: ABC transporter substrate-binding protein [Promethearchaeota archaeon]
MIKKKFNNRVLLIFILLLCIQSTISCYSFVKGNETSETLKDSLTIGVHYGPVAIDPHDAWDMGSFNVIEQVCEGLFTYDYSKPDKEIIPRLALDFGVWTNNGLNYTLSLRENILFHDGNPFNATAVKWNFERLAYFMNVSGTLPGPGNPTTIDAAYRWLDGTPFINRTEVLDLFTIRFVLNRPFGGFEALLCFSGSYILSPASTPATSFIDVISGDLIGSGPFVYDEYNYDVNVTFHSFDNYWRTTSKIQNLTLKIISNSLSLTQALINEEIDMLINPSPLYFENITNAEYLQLIESKRGGWVLHYLGMNNHLIDQSFREAICYAIDYSHIIDNIRGGHAERLKSPIPKSMLFSNYSFDVPIYNLSKAREIMQSMGYGIGWDVTPGGLHEINWTSANFRTLNYTYNTGSTFREQIGDLLMNNLSKIGINVEIHDEPWVTFLYKLFEKDGFTRDMLELFFIAWAADYNDPSQFINALLSNSTYSFNSVQYNGGYGGFTPYSEDNDVQLLMEQAISSIDNEERITLYNKIQQLIIERDFPWAFVYSPIGYIAFHEDLEGIEDNAFINIDAYDKSSVKGNFQLLSWKTSQGPEGIIPGYQMILIAFIALISIISLMKIKSSKLKK